MMFRRSLVLALSVGATDAVAQDTASTVSPVVAAQPKRVPVPFGVGERAEYQVKYGPFSVGRGAMEVLSLDTIRGRETWRTTFRVRGGVPGYRVNNLMESWLDT